MMRLQCVRVSITYRSRMISNKLSWPSGRVSNGPCTAMNMIKYSSIPWQDGTVPTALLINMSPTGFNLANITSNTPAPKCNAHYRGKEYAFVVEHVCCLSPITQNLERYVNCILQNALLELIPNLFHNVTYITKAMVPFLDVRMYTNSMRGGVIK